MSNQSTFTIKQILKDHWSNFLKSNPNLQIRPVVLKEVDKVINCGDFSLGYALYLCSHCNSILHVPFRCKSRFCNTCGMQYVHERAFNLSRKLINCKHRHLVFTIPVELRSFFRKDRSLLNILFQAVAETLLSWFASLNKKEHFIPGFVSTLHTFGRDLKWNPHIHCLVTEGASGDSSVWRHFKHLPYPMLRRRFQTILLNLMEKSLGTSFYHLKTSLFYSYKDGFYVYAKPNPLSDTRKAIQYVVRYTGRPAMAQSRILNYDGSTVTFWYQRHEDNKKVIECISAFDFIKRLIVHIHEPQFKTVRYYGLYARKHKFSHLLFKMLSESKRKFHSRYSHWRERILLSFNRDPLKCQCGHFMELVDIFYPLNLSYNSS
jgi:hypothetical protein